MKELENSIFNIHSKENFEVIAWQVFQFQRNNCAIYKAFIEQLNRPEPTKLSEVPFLPISFFKSHQVISSELPIQFEFNSSGTTGMTRSKHFVQKIEMYEQSFQKIYDDFIGSPKDQIILALLPNYLEQGQSSLVYMVDQLIQGTDNELSGFYLNNYEDLIQGYHKAIEQEKQVVIFGVSYALLDLAERNINLSKAKIIETGGMKGRRKELSKEELHEILKKGLHVESISSEYGMTELFSQSYSDSDGLFKLPQWMDVRIREVNDPFSFVQGEKTGGINIIDLANLYSCSFIETQDLGKRFKDSFQLMGRFDQSDVRGCNLMVE
jgi:phenylacetate-coenzyme A ligase PaaK-like adenylate-forming protein